MAAVLGRRSRQGLVLCGARRESISPARPRITKRPHGLSFDSTGFPGRSPIPSPALMGGGDPRSLRTTTALALDTQDDRLARHHEREIVGPESSGGAAATGSYRAPTRSSIALSAFEGPRWTPGRGILRAKARASLCGLGPSSWGSDQGDVPSVYVVFAP